MTRSKVVIAFIVALTLGKMDTSKAPFTPSGLGPRIKNATAPEIITETIYMIFIQKLSAVFMSLA